MATKISVLSLLKFSRRQNVHHSLENHAAVQNVNSHFFRNNRLPLFIYSVTRLPFSIQRRNWASSLEIGCFPKVQCESSKFTPYRLSAQIMILIAESARCRFASSLSDLVHEIRSFTPLFINISSGVTTAQ